MTPPAEKSPAVVSRCTVPLVFEIERTSAPVIRSPPPSRISVEYASETFVKSMIPVLGDQMALDSGDVRLVLSELFRPDDRQPLCAVGGTPSIQLLKDWHFGLVDRDYQLAAHLVLDAALVAELPQQSAAGGAEVGLL